MSCRRPNSFSERADIWATNILEEPKPIMEDYLLSNSKDRFEGMISFVAKSSLEYDLTIYSHKFLKE
jgi:hypothetical protein